MGFIRTTLVSVWARKRRLFGTTLAVLLGVAFLTGTLVLGDSAHDGIASAIAKGNEGTDVVVRSASRLEGDDIAQAGLLDTAIVDEVGAVDGVAVAAGVVEGSGQVLGSDGQPVGGDGPPTFADGWVDDPRLNSMRLAEGRAPTAPGEIVLDRGAAEDGHLAVDDTATVLVPSPVEVTIVGLVTFGDDDRMSGATYVGFEETEAETLLLGAPGRITSVLAAAAPGISQDELADRVSAVLPDGVEAITGDDLTAEQLGNVEEDFLTLMETFLLVFGGVALLVATASIHNTASILVAQRTRESALLRAVGASRRQLLGSTLLEAAIVGLLGSGLGAATGVGIGAGLRAWLSSSDFMPIDRLVVAPSAIAWSVGIGVTLSLLASLTPAIKASRVPPVAAMRDMETEDAGWSRWRAVLGIGIAVVGGATVLDAADSGSALAMAGLGALLVMIGLILLGPIAARPLSKLIGSPYSLRGVTGRLARGGAERNPRRTAGTAAMLLVGVGVVTTFTVLADSMRSSVEDEVGKAFAGEFVVETPGFSGAGLDPAFTAEVAALPEVDAAASFGDGLVLLDGGQQQVTVTEPAALAEVADFDVQAGDMAAVADDGIAVSSKFADDNDLAIGSALPLAFADGSSMPVRVDAIYGDRALAGDVVLPSQTWRAHATQATTFAALVSLADGVDMDTGRQAIEAVAARYGSPNVFDHDEFVQEQAAEINQILGVIYGMLVLAIIIALFGIAGTLSLSIHERTKELGLLRAVGLDRRQLRRIVRGEAVIVSLLGTVGGLGVGTFVGWGLVRAMKASEGFGTFTVPGGQLGVVVLLGAVVGVIAAVRPARRAARMPVIAALAAT